MKYLKTKPLLFMAVLLIIAACKKDAQSANGITLTDADTGKKLSLTSGQTFTLTLNNPGDGGYNFDSPQRDSSIIHLDKYEHKAPANGLTGDAGSDTWQFTSAHAGTTVLKITASRLSGGTVVMFSDTLVVK